MIQTQRKQKEKQKRREKEEHDASQMSVRIQSPYPKCLSASKSPYPKCLSTSRIRIKNVCPHPNESVRIRNVCPHPKPVRIQCLSVSVSEFVRTSSFNCHRFRAYHQRPSQPLPRHDVEPRHIRKKERRLDARETPSPALPSYHAELAAASTIYARATVSSPILVTRKVRLTNV